MNAIDIERLKRRLRWLIEQRDELLKRHKGNETKFTYWGGYALGCLKGKISEIEDLIDELES